MRLPTITNKNDLSLEMAVWLLHDDYDFIPEEGYISATGLMKPIRHILLPRRIPLEQQVPADVEDFIATAMGKALHAGIEKAWLDPMHVRQALRQLGYGEELIQRVLVNPTKEQLAAKPDVVPVYVEQRTIREIKVGGVTFKVGGKFDMVCDGRVTDTKSTSVYAWIIGGREEQYQLQGSIYRWLNPDKITEDHIRINYIFTDWDKLDAKTRKNYPPRRVIHKDYPLLSMEEIEAWIRAKLKLILDNQGRDEDRLPECTDEELWISEPRYKYYSDPSKAFGGAGRSTRTFTGPDAAAEAQALLQEKGKGIVITVPGTPKRCGYCAAFPICTQKDKYTHD